MYSSEAVTIQRGLAEGTSKIYSRLANFSSKEICWIILYHKNKDIFM